ncbi:hypothetical protein TNCV_1184121 [Trichonephila clavipes]|nr:hypothetical protein TNCV_1184121 [Trichonephila clavipes]
MGSTLNSRQAASPLVRLVEGEEWWEAPDHPRVFSLKTESYPLPLVVLPRPLGGAPHSLRIAVPQDDNMRIHRARIGDAYLEQKTIQRRLDKARIFFLQNHVPQTTNTISFKFGAENRRRMSDNERL